MTLNEQIAPQEDEPTPYRRYAPVSMYPGSDEDLTMNHTTCGSTCSHSEAPMPTTLTVACGCAFHGKLGEAGESLLVLIYCPTHAAAPAAIALVRRYVTAPVGRSLNEIDDDARALLATLGQTGT